MREVEADSTSLDHSKSAHNDSVTAVVRPSDWSRAEMVEVESDAPDNSVERFFSMTEITYVRESQIQEDAWRFMRDAAISPPDSWMLACAVSIPGHQIIDAIALALDVIVDRRRPQQIIGAQQGKRRSHFVRTQYARLVHHRFEHRQLARADEQG